MGLIARWFIYSAISPTALVRIHNPYLPPEIKQANLILGVIMLIPCFGLMLPLAQQTKRSQDAVQVLWSLAAQASRYEILVPDLHRHLNVNVSLHSL